MLLHLSKPHRGVNRSSFLAHCNESGLCCEANKILLVFLGLLKVSFRIKNFPVVGINHVQCKHN